MQLTGRKVLADFMGQRRDARGEFVLIDQDGRSGVALIARKRNRKRSLGGKR